jgi:radical SAM enzyme (TIGR01210 family)
MCDLWQNTLAESVPRGAIPSQIDWALRELRIVPEPNLPPTTPARHLKLYNSGSFFDPRAIPPDDFPAIAERIGRFERVVVESHPSLVSDSAVRFRDLIPGQLEVAMGLEIAHPDVLARLNKRMTLDQFSEAAAFLRGHRIALRVFVLVKPPFLKEDEALEWAQRSIDFAFDCGASAVSLIPTRGGNGAMEALAQLGDYSPPDLSLLEQAVDDGITTKRGRVFADLWDLSRFSKCDACLPARRARLDRINRNQVIERVVDCASCGTHRSVTPPNPASPRED